MKTAIIGIDPGSKSGGMAVLHPDGRVDTIKFSNQTEADVVSWLRDWRRIEYVETPGCPQCFAYLERVSAMPKQGVVSAFTFGQNCGFLRGLLIAFQIPFETVTPGKWQRALSCLSGGDKNVTKARAQELFPTIKITHGIADALLIAEYGRRVREGGDSREH